MEAGTAKVPEISVEGVTSDRDQAANMPSSVMESPLDLQQTHGGSGSIRVVLSFLGIDRAVGMVLLSRAWSFAAGPLTLIFIGRFLRPEEQGYYYTFNSIIALNVFFELGLSFVLVQCASHEWAHLHWTSERLLVGSPEVKARLAAMVTTALKWYAVVAIFVCTGILPAGQAFFARVGHENSGVVWRLPWFWLVIASALNLYINALLSVLEGCGKIAETATARAVQTVIANFALWATLLARGALFAGPIYQTALILVPAAWLYVRYRYFFADLLETDRTGSCFSWRQEVWPFQWRIAVSWLSGYCMLQFFNPILFAFRGPVEAGRMGMTVSVVGALQTAFCAWISTKSAPFGALVSRSEFGKLDKIFSKSLIQSFVIMLVGSFAALTCLFLLRELGHPLAGRLLGVSAFSLLIGTALINHVVYSEAIYLRAHKQEPMLPISILSALCLAPAIYILGRSYGAIGIAAGYCAVTLFIGFGGGTYVFFTKRHLWHAHTSHRRGVEVCVGNS